MIPLMMTRNDIIQLDASWPLFRFLLANPGGRYSAFTIRGEGEVPGISQLRWPVPVCITGGAAGVSPAPSRWKAALSPGLADRSGDQSPGDGRLGLGVNDFAVMGLPGAGGSLGLAFIGLGVLAGAGQPRVLWSGRALLGLNIAAAPASLDWPSAALGSVASAQPARTRTPTKMSTDIQSFCFMPTPFNCGLTGPPRMVVVRWPRIITSRLAAKNPKPLSDSAP
jgi:hypothetical protein